jgi:hypothetical protein
MVLRLKLLTMTQTVNKSDYEVFSFSNGFFGISKIGTFGGELVFGGDSANEDDYNEDYIRDIFAKWDGSLKLQSDWAGHEEEYRIEL